MTKQDITGTFLGKHNLSKTHPTHNEKAFGMAIGMWIETYQNKNRKLWENSSFLDTTYRKWIKSLSESNISKLESLRETIKREIDLQA